MFKTLTTHRIGAALALLVLQACYSGTAPTVQHNHRTAEERAAMSGQSVAGAPTLTERPSVVQPDSQTQVGPVGTPMPKPSPGGPIRTGTPKPKPVAPNPIHGIRHP